MCRSDLLLEKIFVDTMNTDLSECDLTNIDRLSPRH